jgi:hypothetical protein
MSERTFILWKCAASLDGRIAAAEARADGHRLRAECGAVMVGSGTQQADDPQLAVRDAEVTRQPLRILVDRARSSSRWSDAQRVRLSCNRMLARVRGLVHHRVDRRAKRRRRSPARSRSAEVRAGGGTGRAGGGHGGSQRPRPRCPGCAATPGTALPASAFASPTRTPGPGRPPRCCGRRSHSRCPGGERPPTHLSSPVCHNNACDESTSLTPGCLLINLHQD